MGCKKGGHWLRYTGNAIFMVAPKYAEAMLEGLPEVKELYEANPDYKMMTSTLRTPRLRLLRVALRRHTMAVLWRLGNSPDFFGREATPYPH